MWDPFKTSNVRVSIVDALNIHYQKKKVLVSMTLNLKLLLF